MKANGNVKNLVYDQSVNCVPTRRLSKLLLLLLFSDNWLLSELLIFSSELSPTKRCLRLDDSVDELLLILLSILPSIVRRTAI